ncbi:hypothetical protein DFP72DRAFT_1067880 [Ephemerocybe angulata]|uniref:Fungal-type protein kinase domain-containing protein n=1 Tax=Ephemerocybe angulata TaxID=980116 RepID=A0A8H6I0G8_9AGAR|nr:hypothetical protein DFP72DRAFT_1067880 [Tulosesus angulatus]
MNTLSFALSSSCTPLRIPHSHPATCASQTCCTRFSVIKAPTKLFRCNPTATLQSIQRELDGHITIADGDWARKLYSKSVSPELIDKIKQSLNVVNGRFFDIPETVDAKSDLYCPLVHILKIIVSTSGNSYSVNHDYSVNRDRVDTREVVDTHGRVLQKWIVDSDFSPDIVIQATGNSFELPRTCYMSPGDDDSVGYTNITTAVDLGLDTETGDEDVDIFEQVYRMAVHAKEMYVQQPNRHFVRVLFMTETRLRLIEFNRGGVITTRFINYHDDPDTLIRLIIGLSSPNEETIGMDITIRWKEENGRKIPDGNAPNGNLGNVVRFSKKVPEFCRILHFLDISEKVGNQIAPPWNLSTF